MRWTKCWDKPKEVTRNGKHSYVEYAKFADDLVVLVDAYTRHEWLIGAVTKQLCGRLAGFMCSPRRSITVIDPP